VRIALVYSHLKELGGAENVILKQFELLHKDGYDTKCYFAYVDKSQKKGTPNPHNYIESYFHWLLPCNKTARIILSMPLAPLTLKVFKEFDVLLCHGYGPAPLIGYFVKRFLKKNYVSYIHSPPRFLYLDDESKERWRFDDTRGLIILLSKMSGPLLKKLDYLGIINSDRILVNSFFTAKRVREIYGVKAKVCYPPLDTSVFKILPQKMVKSTRRRFGWPLILSTGRIVAVKRWEWLIEIMPYMKREFPSTTLAITGEISSQNIHYVRFLSKLAKSRGVAKNVRFLGYKSLGELVSLYNAADVYTYTVPKEDFGLGPVEAMSCGTPAVVWNDGGGPCETVIDGKTGFKAKPYDIEDFAQKAMKAVDFEKCVEGRLLHNFVEENFSCGRHLQILKETIENL
jgi:glycosyltransferase involved in cell wall biosynthesis